MHTRSRSRCLPAPGRWARVGALLAVAVLFLGALLGVGHRAGANSMDTPEAEASGETRLIVGFTPGAIQRGDAGEAHDEVGGDPVERIRDVSVDVVAVADIDRAVNEYLEQPGVRYVEVDHRVAAFADDPLYGQQWNLHPLNGSNRGTANVERAWDTSRGRDAVVAVVDTGVRVGGSDLDPSRVLPGKDFVNSDDDPTDDNGHGTHVAGTVAQSTDNARGVAGVAPDARILPVKVLDADGAGFYSDIIEGIVWAKNQGADVINLSLGAYEPSQALCDAVINASNAGTVVVAAAGNEGASVVAYPAACDGALAVGAVRYDGSVMPYSNRGEELALVAPGGDMSLDQSGDGYADGILQQNFTTSWGYRFYEGTSMAAPHVSGAAALVLAANPSAWVERVLLSTARDLGTSGWDSVSGYGALDAAEAVRHATQSGSGPGDGYWLATEAGAVRGFGSAPGLGSASSRGVTAPVVAIEETPGGGGYWLLDADGGVHGFGDASYHGSVSELRAAGMVGSGTPVLDISTTPTGRGYWILDAAGGIFTFGDASFFGSVPGLRNEGVPIGPATVVDLASTPTGRGYWLLDDAGGMFAFGDAGFRGSVPGLRNAGHSIGPAQIVAMAPTADGGGYWLIDDVGGMFAFGSAHFHGSIPGLRNSGVRIGKAIIVAMEPTGTGAGYWMVDDAGGIFTFGDAPYHGSLPASGVTGTAIGLAPSG